MRASNSTSLLMQHRARRCPLSLGACFALSAHAAAPGITGPTFNLTAA